MDNPEKLGTFGTQDTGRRQKQKQKNNNNNNKNKNKNKKTKKNPNKTKKMSKEKCWTSLYATIHTEKNPQYDMSSPTKTGGKDEPNIFFMRKL